MSESASPAGGVNPSDKGSVSSWAIACWCDALGTVIQSLTAARPRIEIQPPGAGKANPGEMDWWEQSFNLAPEPCIRVGAPAGAWKSLVQGLLQTLGAEAPGDSDLETTRRDLLAQTSSAFAQRLSEEFHEQVTSGEIVRAAAPGAGPEFSFQLAIGNRSPFEATVFLAPPFLARLQEMASGVQNQAQAGQQSNTSRPLDGPMPNGPKVELRVRVVLGRANLPLRDIFKLNVGSVIELDRSVADAAEIMVDEYSIAQGHIVVVDGNYGIKVIA